MEGKDQVEGDDQKNSSAQKQTILSERQIEPENKIEPERPEEPSLQSLEHVKKPESAGATSLDKVPAGSQLARLTAIAEVEEDKQSMPSVTSDSQDILLDMTRRTAKATL